MNSNERVRISYEQLKKNARESKILIGEGTEVARTPFPEKVKTMFWYAYYLSEKYTFLDAFVDEYCDAKRSKNWEVNNSLNTKEECAQHFNLSRIEFLKAMFFTDSLVQRICDYNIDKSVLQDGFDPAKAREAFLWLMCKSNPAEILDIQDLNRLKTFFKIQCNRDLRLAGKYYDTTHVDKKYDLVMNSLPSSRSGRVGAVRTFKDILQNLIHDTFEQYEVLFSYRKYLLTLTASDDMDIIKQDIIDLRNAIVIANAVKRVFLSFFCSYLKIPNLELGHSELSDGHFSRANISDSNFINSNFKYTQIDNAVASGSDFSICNFMMCNAKGSTLNNCTFNYSNMSGMNLSNASLSESLLDAVIFRDNQLDVSIEFANQLLGNSENKELGGLYCQKLDERKRVLEELKTLSNTEADRIDKLTSTDTAIPEDQRIEVYSIERIRTFARSLTKDSQDNPDIKELTFSKSEDKTPHLLVNDHDTIFDEVLKKMGAYLDPMWHYCRNKVIDKDLLHVLAAAEVYESAQKRKERFREFGAVCFKPTILRGTSFSNCSMPQIDLSLIDMTNATFIESDLSRSLGYYCEAKNSSFAKANVIGGEFFESNFDNSNFSGSNCINATFINCGLHALNISNALANGIAIINLKKKTAFLTELLRPIESSDPDSVLSKLSENVNDSEYLTDELIDIADSNWMGTSASNAIFMGMKMDRSNFSTSDLSNSTFFNCAVRWASFNKCDFPYSLLLGSSFHQSVFSDSMLSQTRVFCSEFSGCRMTNLIFIGVRCEKALFYHNDMSDANFSRSIFRNCIFRNCNFTNLNISNSVFEHCTFYNVDFQACIGLASASFEECIFPDMHSINDSNDFEEDAPRRIILNNKNEKQSRTDDVIVEQRSAATYGNHDLYTSIKR